jgi:hypothetical protein
MACCGQNRQALNTSAAHAANRGTVGYPAKAFTPSPLPSAVFEYIGDRVLTVVGQGTGITYRFSGRGARYTVDGRDRASLARVPQLREVANGAKGGSTTL